MPESASRRSGREGKPTHPGECGGGGVFEIIFGRGSETAGVVYLLTDPRCSSFTRVRATPCISYAPSLCQSWV
jgi:hypothetical protein